MKKTVKILTAFLLTNMVAALPSSANTSIHINSNSLANLTWQDVAFSETVKTTLSEQQKQHLTLPFAGTESPIATYRIPANQGALQIEIVSPVGKDSVFVPSAIVLDSHFNVAATYPSSEFKFYEERGMQPNRYAAELKLTPAPNQNYIYLLVYTTQQDLAKSTMVPHPAKTYAKGTGKQPPALDDIEVKHSLNGQISVNVTNSDGTRFIGIPTNVFSSEKSSKTIATSAAPVVMDEKENVNKATAPIKAVPHSATAQNAPVTSNKAVEMPVDKDTEAYFNQAVTKALKAGDVNKAMNLVNEAEKLGLTSTRQIFLKHVSSK